MKIADPPSEGNARESDDASSRRPGLLKTNEAAQYLGISPRTFQGLVAAGLVPRAVFKKPGATKGPVRFRPADLDRYVASCVDDPVSRERRS